MNNEEKSIIFLKYIPTIMALTCAIKIFLFYNNMPIICQYINIVLNTFIVYGACICGKLYGFSSRHSKIGLIAIMGYIGYSILLITNIHLPIVYYLTVAYLIFVVIMTLLYRKI